MNLRHSCLVASAVVTLVVSNACVASTGSPARKREVTIERMVVAPSSYDAMFDDSELVAHVRILAGHPQVIDRPGGLPGVVTEYTAQIVKVIKGSYSRAQSIRFVQQAGRAETADAIVTVLGSEPLTVGRDYFVFLRNYPYLHTLVITNDPEGAFEIREGRIKPAGASRVADERRDVPEADFLRELGKMSERRR